MRGVGRALPWLLKVVGGLAGGRGERQSCNPVLHTASPPWNPRNFLNATRHAYRTVQVLMIIIFY